MDSYSSSMRMQSFVFALQTYTDYSNHVPIRLAERLKLKLKLKLAITRRLKAKQRQSTRNFEDKMNVVLFGIDCTSVSQAYRLLPRTVGYLRQKMDGISFKGYVVKTPTRGEQFWV